MNCTICYNHCTLDQISVCLDQSCKENIFCSGCMIKHPSYHKKPTPLKRFLNQLQSNLPNDQVLQSINSEKAIGELEHNYQRSNKLFKQLKESVIRQIDIVMNHTTSLYDHLHKQYTQTHAKIVKIHSQRQLIERINKDSAVDSLKVLINEYKISSLDLSNSSSNPPSTPTKTQSSSSLYKNSSTSNLQQSVKHKSSFDQINQAHNNIYRKFENIHKEVCAFNEFSHQILERELDKSSQLMYESFENIKKFISVCASSTQRVKSPNKFLDTLQPLFQKEEQIICHKNNMPVQAIVVNGKQNQVITASFDCNIIVRDIHNLVELHTHKAHSQWIRALALQEYSINNPFQYSKGILLSCGDDKIVQLWRLNTSSTPSFPSSSPLEQQNSTISSNNLQPQQNILSTLPFQINQKACLLCMLSSNQVAVCTGPTDNHKIFIYDIISGQCLKVLSGNRKYIRSVIFMEDKNYLCTGSDDGIIGLWHLKDRNHDKFKFRVSASLFPVQALIYEEKKSILCAGCQDGKILIYQINQEPKLIKIIQSSTCTQVSALCKLNSTYFVAAVGKSILVYLFSNGSLVNSINNKNSNNISCISYCPQYQKLFVGDVRGQLSTYAVLIV